MNNPVPISSAPDMLGPVLRMAGALADSYDKEPFAERIRQFLSSPGALPGR